ncbi:unnamed protein product, partial [Boreogadus saida]
MEVGPQKELSLRLCNEALNEANRLQSSTRDLDTLRRRASAKRCGDASSEVQVKCGLFALAHPGPKIRHWVWILKPGIRREASVHSVASGKKRVVAKVTLNWPHTGAEVQRRVAVALPQ